MSALNIQVDIFNADQSPEIYAGTESALSIRFTNKTGAPITLNSGDPKVSPPPKGGYTEFVFDFSMFYKMAGDQGNVTITATGWTPVFIPDADFPSWSVCPAATTTWAVDGEIVFAITKITPTADMGTVYFSSALYNLGSVYSTPDTPSVMITSPPTTDKDLSLSMQLTVTVNPPDQKNGKSKLISNIGITKDPDNPYINSIQLTFSNKSANTPIVADKVPWGDPGPLFIVSFIPATAAPGYYAITTPNAIHAFGFDIASGTIGWKTPRTTLGTPVTWILEPDDQTNHAILGTGTKAIAQFNITNIITDFVNGPTLLYVQYLNVPGYNNGYFSALITKEYPEMTINSFSITPQQIVIDANPLPAIQLNWDVSNATYVEISGVGKVNSKSNNDGLQVLANMDTAFVLTAVDMVVGDLKTASAPITFSPPISQRWTPTGSITVWNGEIATIPPGWALCDGNNGTPDLRDLFIMGAGGANTPGNNDHKPVHNHSLANFKVTAGLDNAGAHEHHIPAGWYARNLSCGQHTGVDAGGNDMNVTFQSAGDHTHTLNVDFTSVQTDNNTDVLLPNWYALCYIMLLNPA